MASPNTEAMIFMVVQVFKLCGTVSPKYCVTIQKPESLTWENPTLIYGFSRDMPDFMRASNFIVTKAGPGTIAEALNAQLPIILYAKLPGQEDGNVTFVEEEGAGVRAPRPEEVVRALTRWISRPAEKQKIIENCKRAGRPEAARVIAHTIGDMLGLKKQAPR
jgi:1,2-diacylglycerol 3-beta-galactosyltransferase